MEMWPLEFSSAGLTDVGHRRERNEDAMLVLEQHGVFCLADGMGGAVRGHEASEQIITCVEEAFGKEPVDTPIKVLDQALRHANRSIFERAQRIHATGMGSTVVALVLQRGKPDGMIFHAGDSRAYRLRKGSLTRLTADHTLAAEIGLPDEGRPPTFLDSMLTRAIGLATDVELVAAPIDLTPGDIYLLCSDGLNKHVNDQEIANYLRQFPKEPVERIARTLIDVTRDRGAIDNVSVVVVGIAS